MPDALHDHTAAGRTPSPSPVSQPPAPTTPGGGGTVDGPARRHGPSTPLLITVIGRPAPQGSKRHVGGGRMIESSKRLKPWREAVKHAALDKTREFLAYPADGPLLVELVFCFDKPRSAPKRRRVWPITRSSGDIDKLTRATLDALTDAAVFRDDAQVVHLIARKVHTDDDDAPLAIPGAVIAVSEVTA